MAAPIKTSSVEALRAPELGSLDEDPINIAADDINPVQGIAQRSFSEVAPTCPELPVAAQALPKAEVKPSISKTKNLHRRLV